ncbi:hypothetical protein HJC99_02735 [Candidatus Saccharibacteria bacterium]|nr:hypothetical protein [Candidatus Saccharibacteria bacterium]
MNRLKIAQNTPVAILATEAVAVVVFALNWGAHGAAVASMSAAVSNTIVALIMGVVVVRAQPPIGIGRAMLYGLGLWLASTSIFIGIFMSIQSHNKVIGLLIGLIMLAAGVGCLAAFPVPSTAKS